MLQWTGGGLRQERRRMPQLNAHCAFATPHDPRAVLEPGQIAPGILRYRPGRSAHSGRRRVAAQSRRYILISV